MTHHQAAPVPRRHPPPPQGCPGPPGPPRAAPHGISKAALVPPASLVPQTPQDPPKSCPTWDPKGCPGLATPPWSPGTPKNPSPGLSLMGSQTQQFMFTLNPSNQNIFPTLSHVPPLPPAAIVRRWEKTSARKETTASQNPPANSMSPLEAAVLAGLFGRKPYFFPSSPVPKHP